MKKFAQSHFRNVVYAQFDKDRVLRKIFQKDFDVARIIRDLETLFHTHIEEGNTILLLDEIQACRDALTSLKYFCEDRPKLPIVAAGSLLGLTYRNDDAEDGSDEETTGFPVGKVNTLSIHPFSFTEFLAAIGEERLAGAVRDRQWDTLETFSERLEDVLRHYFVVGGMPEAVATYVKTRNFLDVRDVHREILSGYRRDISKHAPKGDIRKIEMCWSSIPVQLAKENKRFFYSTVKNGGRASEFRDPLAWLEDAGLIFKVGRTNIPNLPLSAYADGAFKVYMLDVGLLSALSGLDPKVVLEGARIFKEFKGALTEQYVHQQLVAETTLTPYYYSTEDSRTEIDFLIQKGMAVIPIEVKSGGNVHSQSLKSYERRFDPKDVYRASALAYKEQTMRLDSGEVCHFTNIPLVAIGMVEQL